MATDLTEGWMSPHSRRGASLTADERTALSLSATGLTVTEVAETLGWSPAVVHGVLASAIDKLGARSKLEAVVIAARIGQISLPH